MIPNEFAGKVAIVTGGSRGLGLAITRSLVTRGVRVVALDLDADPSDDLAALASGVEGALRYISADVSDEEQFARAVADCARDEGRLDILINNAGISQVKTPIVDTSLDDFDRVLRVDLRGVMIGLKHAATWMVHNGGGCIVNISSAMGLVAQPGIAAYAAAKHGVIGLTKTAALELGPRGVRVNAVCPGRHATPMITALREQGYEQSTWDAEVARNHPATGRVGHPDETAEAVAFLCSSGASNIHGIALPVDGGWTAQ